MVVGDNIAIRGENKAGAGGCRLYRLTEEVVAVGPGTKDEPMELKVGDTVVFSKYGGTEIKYQGEEYWTALLGDRNRLEKCECNCN